MQQTIYDIAVVGAGPAGMTAALYAARAGRSVILFEGVMYGGQIVQSALVENYPGAPDVDGYTLAEQMMQPVRALQVPFVNESVERIEKNGVHFTVKTNAARYEARAVILATGVEHRRLNVTGEDRFIGHGVSFCATCDGRFYRNREVAVVGGGNTAVQDALELSAFCKKVYLIHRRDEFRAERGLAARLQKAENIELIKSTVITEIKGETAVQSLVLQNVLTKETTELPVAGLFEAVGMIPKNTAFASLVELDGEGYIITDEDGTTSTAGMYAAGDCRRKRVRQLTTATADGTVAALAAVEYVAKLSESEDVL